MTAQLLSNELSTLIQDSKRKNHELKNAAEKSLSELKALPQTSEAQLSADLRNRPTFVRPYVLACNTRNVKYAGTAVICLQRLILIRALAKESLGQVIQAFRECISLTVEVQLKILQALPSLLQNYAGALSDTLLAAAFEVCFLLYNSKTAVVCNTAAAALQQLLSSTFEKVPLEESSSTDEAAHITEAPTDDGTVKLGGASADAYRLLNDVCLMTEGQRPKFLAVGSLSQNFGFELIESVLSNYTDAIMEHLELVHVLRLRLMPLILKILSEKVPFATTVRVMRLLQLVISRLLYALAPECEQAIHILNRTIDSDSFPSWKRALAMEVFRDLHADPTLMRSIYAHYDEDDHRKNIVGDHLASLVRLASEKPNIIGLGQQSSMSARPKEKDDWADSVALQAGGIVGSIGAVINAPESDTPGISTRWSIPRTPCLELLDKSEPPSLPPSYLYALAVTCISTFSDGLGKFLLPFTSPKEIKTKKNRIPTEEVNGDGSIFDTASMSTKRLSRRSKKALLNPLSLKDHVLYPQIKTSGEIVEHCWPALLAVSSTFLNATLDSDFYHALIRSIQKFTQIAGLLGLATPRDAFLTTLAKHSVPIGRSLTILFRPSLDHGSQPDSNENSDLESSPTPSKRTSIDPGTNMLTPRNLLCLRALLNLGIALGPLLQSSWSIILEALQQADLMLPKSNKGRQRTSTQPTPITPNQVIQEESKDGEDFGLEVHAAETAASRMIESSIELPDDAFLDFVNCLSALTRFSERGDDHHEDNHDGLLSPQTPAKKHQRLPSLSTGAKESAQIQSNIFVLDKYQQLIQCNVNRLTDTQSKGCLDFFTKQLGKTLSSHESITIVRRKAAEILRDLIVLVTTSREATSEDLDTLRQQMLSAILTSISALYGKVQLQSRDSQNCDVEIHCILLEALRSILEQSGDSLQNGWGMIFDIITSTFDRSSKRNEGTSLSDFLTRSPKVVRSSYGSLQLVCSDYLNNVPLACLPTLLDALYMFSLQSQELNISLTTTTFFANVSGFLHQEGERLDFDATIAACASDRELISVIKDDSSNTPRSHLWVLLMSRLKSVTGDERMEVRHSALHTIFRIFTDCEDDLSPSAWRTCFQVILSQLLVVNQQKYQHISSDGLANVVNDNLNTEWNRTAVIIVEGISSTMSNNLNIVKRDSTFPRTWHELLQHLRLFLDRKVLELSKAVFAGQSATLEEIEDANAVSGDAIDEAWALWKRNNPASHNSLTSGSLNNQDALLSYLRYLSQILRLKDAELRARLADDVIAELQICVMNARLPPYSTDIERTSAVQQGILENLKMIPITSPTVLFLTVRFLAFLISLPYQKTAVNKQEQTYLAMSKAAVELLQSLVIRHGKQSATSYELIRQALSALAKPIQLKYKWYVAGEAPSLWRKATTTVLEILENCMADILQTEASSETTEAFWKQVFRVIDGVVTADYDSCATSAKILEDQDFDINAFHRLQQLVIPALGSTNNAKSLCMDYAKIVFEKSLIHEPHPDDLAREDQELLDGLTNRRIGRTYDVPPTPRIKMSYVLVDELFSLVTIHDGTPERIRLAQAAAPYLILRAGLVLKAYMLDHPLRGRAPQPGSQKREMLHVLRKLVELDCEPKAMPQGPTVNSQNKGHLYRLYPLLTKALKAASRNVEMTEALEEVLDATGEDFGF